MELYSTHLPWTSKPVRTTGDVTEHWRHRLPESLRYHLPKKIWIFCDLEVPETDVRAFLESAVAHLESEFKIRERRKEIFVERGLLAREEIEPLLREQRGGQAWALYYSADGGLGVGDRGFFQPDGGGCVPCSSMINHGVAWQRTLGTGLEVWLATAPKAGQDWDWESDIGHESAHAAFAPVPLYMQTIQARIGSYRFDYQQEIGGLSPEGIAKMGYMYSEFGVIALRGEFRNTETGLPSGGDKEEVCAFLELSHKLMPGFGFDKALSVYSGVNGAIDVNDGEEIFFVGAPVLRALWRWSFVANQLQVPKLETLISKVLNPFSPSKSELAQALAACDFGRKLWS